MHMKEICLHYLRVSYNYWIQETLSYSAGILKMSLTILNNSVLFLKALSRALGEEKCEGTKRLVKLHF